MQRMDKVSIIQAVLSGGGEILKVTEGCLVTFREDDTLDDVYVLDSQQSFPIEFWESLLHHGLIGYVYHGQRTITLRNVANDPRWIKVDGGHNSGSVIGVPLRDKMHVFGVMLFMHPQVDYFSIETEQLVQEIGDMASHALMNALDHEVIETEEVRYRHSFDGAVVPIMLTTMNGDVIDANPRTCDFLGYQRDALMNQPIQTVNGINEAIVKNGDLNALSPLEEHIYTTIAYKQDRTEVPVNVRIRRLHLQGRDVVEWVLQDATTQLELEQLRADLSAMIYHDLRGPLHTINGSITKLGSVLAGHENPAVLTLLQIGIQSTRQLRRMVDSLLDIRRLEDGNAILDCQPMELRVLLIDAVQLVQPLIFDAGQKLRFNVPSDLPLVEIDGDMMVRVVINLIENATKYTPEGGDIVLGAQVDEANNQVKISVSDSGPGIPYHLQHQIFDKFNRVNYTDAPPGVGLGLAFCRIAVEAHGGTIWVESEPGNGASFVFTLPLDTETIDSERVAQI